jgi:hypothetical protein
MRIYKENIHVGLPAKEERSHGRELINFNGHQETVLFHAMANEESSL